MKCPKCGVRVSGGSAECPGCGVIFAKLEKLKEREKALAVAPIAAPDAPLPRIDIRYARMIAVGLILLWLLGFGLYYRRVVSAARARAVKTDIRTRPTTLMRDPRTGELIPVEVLISPSSKKR